MNDDDEMNETGKLSQIRFLNGSDKNLASEDMCHPIFTGQNNSLHYILHNSQMNMLAKAGISTQRSMSVISHTLMKSQF